MSDDPICPILSIATMKRASDQVISPHQADNVVGGPIFYEHCLGPQCAWFVDDRYTTESRQAPGGCALKLIAQTNSDGKVTV